MKRLRAALGNMPLASIKPRHIYQYVDKRSAKTAAKREIEVHSHAYTKVVEWGYLDFHPFKGEVRFGGEKPRSRYVEDLEIVECLSLESRRKSGSVLTIQAYARIKLDRNTPGRPAGQSALPYYIDQNAGCSTSCAL